MKQRFYGLKALEGNLQVWPLSGSFLSLSGLVSTIP
jgi:hypothetical protein